MPLGSLWHQAWNECKIIRDASCFHLLFWGADELTSVLVSLKIHSVYVDLFTPSVPPRVVVLRTKCAQFTRLGDDPLHRVLMSVFYFHAMQITIYIIVNSLYFCLGEMSLESCSGMIERRCSVPLCMPNDYKLCCLRMLERWWERRGREREAFEC